MKFTNETHKRILADIHEEVIRRIDSRDSSIRSSREEGWMSAMSLAEDIINSAFLAQKNADESRVADKVPDKTADVPAQQAPSATQPKVKGVVVMVRGKPIYQPMDTVSKIPEEKNSAAEKTIGNAINHPAHYNSGKIEVIDFLEDQNLPFHLANAVKYICRAGKKNPYKISEDLQKAIWYINRYIDFVEDKPEPKSADEPGGNDHV